MSRLRNCAGGESVSVNDILKCLGTRSFSTLLLVPALILISPLSGIPGVPTLGALAILLVTAQVIAGRRQLWLPQMILRRKLKTGTFMAGLRWLQRPVDFIDRHTHRRLAFLSHRPFSVLAVAICMALAATMPFLELLPMATSLAATGIAILSTGMMVSDGLVMLLGYATVGGWVSLLGWLLLSATGG